MQERSYPPTSTVALMVFPAAPAVSTLTAGVSCPLTTRPAETDHTYVGDAPGSPTSTLTLKVTAAPASATSLDAVRVTAGHGGGSVRERPQTSRPTKDLGSS